MRTFCISSQDYIICCNGETTRHSHCLVDGAADQATQEHPNLSSTFNCLAILKSISYPLASLDGYNSKHGPGDFKPSWNGGIGIQFSKKGTKPFYLVQKYAVAERMVSSPIRESRENLELTSSRMLMQVVLRRTRLSKTICRYLWTGMKLSLSRQNL